MIEHAAAQDLGRDIPSVINKEADGSVRAAPMTPSTPTKTEGDMEHGEQRNWKEVTEYGANAEFKDAKTGEVVYNGPMCSHTFTQSERFCRNCGWVTCKGILGAILCPSCNETW